MLGILANYARFCRAYSEDFICSLSLHFISFFPLIWEVIWNIVYPKDPPLNIKQKKYLFCFWYIVIWFLSTHDTPTHQDNSNGIWRKKVYRRRAIPSFKKHIRLHTSNKMRTQIVIQKKSKFYLRRSFNQQVSFFILALSCCESNFFLLHKWCYLFKNVTKPVAQVFKVSSQITVNL